MILSILLAISLNTAHAAPTCSSHSKEVVSFVNSYIKAYNMADTKKLKSLMSASFWEQFEDFAPKQRSLNKKYTALIKETLQKNGYCFVNWKLEGPATVSQEDTWFYLKEDKDSWIIMGISGERPQ